MFKNILFRKTFKLIQNSPKIVVNNHFYSTEKSVRKDPLNDRFDHLKSGPDLRDFLIAGKNLPKPTKWEHDGTVPYVPAPDYNGHGRKVHFEVYGCQMNVNDTEIIWSILRDNGYTKADDDKSADVTLLITCAIRENAELKIWNRLHHLRSLKLKKKRNSFQIGILGCMAERLKTDLLEKEGLIDVVAGPDSYKDLPRLLSLTRGGQSAVNVLLSLDETYADVRPVRLNEGAVTAFVSIMRGCDNMCSYCIVPFTRGRERSRPISSIESDVRFLVDEGVKEITLLGQNVNSYRDLSAHSTINQSRAPGFETVYKERTGGLKFAELLQRIAESVPDCRIRFTSPHPKDFPDPVLAVMNRYPNICKSIHLPAQSGSSTVLDRMRRGYTRDAYLQLVDRIRGIIPSVTLSSDFICGFCGETDDEFSETLSLIERVQYNVAYLFAYSMREKTTAHRRYVDDVPEPVKNQRLQEMSKTFRKVAAELNSRFIGNTQTILIESTSKRSELELYGRNDGNIKVIVPDEPIPNDIDGNGQEKRLNPGDYISVRITQSNSQVLKGVPLHHTTLS